MSSLNADIVSKEFDKLDLLAGLIGSALINRNGLTIYSRLPRDIDERKFGAMAATLLGSMEVASSVLNDKISNLTVEFEEYQLIVLTVNADIILAILIEIDVDLGLFLVEIEEFIEKLKK
jgi:predicted regulator of Ras-like GTPase activity (Roadblock/LC7/MglB family)